MLRATLVCGFWGQNIGNAFFNLGGAAVLREACSEVTLVQDQPAYWTFRNERRGSYGNAFGLVDELDTDILILQGPLFTKNFANIWLSTLRELERRGTRWAVLSGAFRKYTVEELQVASRVIGECPPAFISTRDDVTADLLADVYPGVRRGIDSAFFLRHAYTPASLRSDSAPYMCLCFDHYPEPRLVNDPSGALELGGLRYTTQRPANLDRMAGRNKGVAYLANLFDFRKLPSSVAGLRVVRPEHRTNPHLPHKIYRRPNSQASDEPWTYLAAYANATVTLSDRVHACIASIAYGVPAHLTNPATKRKALFSALGLEDIESRVVSVPLAEIDRRFVETADYVRSISAPTAR